VGIWNASGVSWCPSCRQYQLSVRSAYNKFLGIKYVAEQCAICGLILCLENGNDKNTNKRDKKKRRKRNNKVRRVSK
jgi:hypothetical protein